MDARDTELRSSPLGDAELKKELDATLQARRELGPEYESALVDSFLEKVEQRVDGSVDRRIRRQLAEQQMVVARGGRPSRSDSENSFGERFGFAMVSLILAIAALRDRRGQRGPQRPAGHLARHRRRQRGARRARLAVAGPPAPHEPGRLSRGAGCRPRAAGGREEVIAGTAAPPVARGAGRRRSPRGTRSGSGPVSASGRPWRSGSRSGGSLTPLWCRPGRLPGSPCRHPPMCRTPC